MTLEDFKNKMRACRYSNEYVELIDGKLVMFNFYTDEIHNVSNYEDNNRMITHASFERLLNKKIEVLSFMRDAREDTYDDRGFSMFIAKHKDKYIFGSYIANYNLEFTDSFIESDNIDELDEGIDYRFFESINEIEEFLEKIISLAELCETSRRKYIDELIPQNTDDKFIIEIFENFGSAFWEYYEENIKLIRSLTKFKYKPRLYDEPSFYDGWIEDQTETFICKI